MTHVLIACIILAVGAAAEIVAYIFSAKLLKKREEGLDRRKEQLDRCEEYLKDKATDKNVIDADRFILISRKKTISIDDVASIRSDFRRKAALELQRETLEDVKKFISVYLSYRPDGDVDLMSLIWVSKGGDIHGLS